MGRFEMRKGFVAFSVIGVLLNISLGFIWFHGLLGLVFLIPIIIVGVIDMGQRKHSIRRNFPVLGRARWLLESIRPEIQQYFIESNVDGKPFSRERRSLIYSRAKNEISTLPFGTQMDVYQTGYEWVNHSLAPKNVQQSALRILVGGPACKQPYSASIFNISGMSFGSLSKNAVLALNKGAKMGGFAQSTGEGGLTPYHLEPGGDVIWNVGTGYFSCRTPGGKFDAAKFAERANLPSVKMIELKLSQGAKPGHGGILPAKKLTQEIANIRGVSMGEDVLSPPSHSAFNSPIGLLKFVDQLRTLSGGKPVGFKFCVGKRREFLAICKAMIETGLLPDFIVIDGGEGGTGAAPLEFSNHVGSPLNESLVFVHNALVGIGIRKDIRLLVSGRITTGFDIVSKICMGADICYSARAMMMALGCIQALQCNTNKCPTGVATQNPWLVRGLAIDDKMVRVKNYHHGTLESVCEIMGAMGVETSGELRPWHLMRRFGPFEVKHYGEIFDYLENGALLRPTPPKAFGRAWSMARADSFESSSPS
ncbi:MAG: FMN-binding glutamate synthase family protein [Proteobacteria bacterium]|nr:FMN-binding glutamate synthase family protein [Pseudomonadota bacterium]